MALKKRNYISLRSILIVWFFVFSIFPLALVAFYSVVKFQKAIENEQLQRLKSNAREIEVMIADFYNELRNNREILSTNPYVTFNLSVGDEVALKDFFNQWLASSEVSHVSVYNREGKKMAFAEKEYYSSIRMTTGATANFLDRKIISHLNEYRDFGYIKGVETGVELVLISKVQNSGKKNIGFIEQKYLLKQTFLSRIKNELKLEMLLLNEKFEIVNSTLVNFDAIGAGSLNELKKAEPDSLVDVQVGSNAYAFMVYSVLWDQTPFRIVIGTSKKESQAVLKNINVAFLGVTGLGVVILIITIFISTALLLKPVNELIDGLLAFENTDSLVQIKVKNRTEIGLLISAFNQMSMKVFRSRNDLQSKITELERANINLKEAQTQLVQSAKMTSLGQLVAGVAHELNNPIGFIYSNTSHLLEYSENLFKIIDSIEKNPALSRQVKEEYEFDYIRKDLPLLIKSCQEGAQRTRDIVLGLRNFSRLEESQLKEIDLHESINMTLELLKGETKNRIQIHQEFENIPLIHCYASQINQVIMNILTNAVHAINGNGNIWIKTKLLEQPNEELKRIQISIRDSGTGMSPDVVEKIFEPFFTTKDVGQGTGLGLSISYGIVQNHGGDIKVKSEIGVGTEFLITFPISQNIKTT